MSLPNKLQKSVGIRITIALLLLFIDLNCDAMPLNDSSNGLYIYQYEQTRQLVHYVRTAAHLFHQEGKKAFPVFRKEEIEQSSNQPYIFMYTMDGKAYFNAAEKSLQGQNLLHLHDLSGKPVIQYAIDIVKRDKEGWLHYLWEKPGDIFPAWKTSYVMSVKAPDGTAYIIGAGLYDMKLEKSFLQATVDQAVELIKTIGPDPAFKQFISPASPYIYQGSTIFVLNLEGLLLVDPAFPYKISAKKTVSHRNIKEFQDVNGNFFVKTILQKLRHSNSHWIVYTALNRDNQHSEKIMYVKKVKTAGKTYIVGISMFLDHPIWMKN